VTCTCMRVSLVGCGPGFEVVANETETLWFSLLKSAFYIAILVLEVFYTCSYNHPSRCIALSKVMRFLFSCLLCWEAVG
jgi:hypothetical protein